MLFPPICREAFGKRVKLRDPFKGVPFYIARREKTLSHTVRGGVALKNHENFFCQLKRNFVNYLLSTPSGVKMYMSFCNGAMPPPRA